MRLLYLLICLPLTTFAQSGEEIWRDLLTRYQSLSNYVDQGEYESVIYGNRVSVSNYDYFLAMDSAMNVNHWFRERYTGNTKYKYQKQAGTDDGVFTRNLSISETEPRTLKMACASLAGVGGSILLMTSELMFPEIFGDDLRPRDSIVALQDTIIQSQPCKAIALHSSYYQTQEMIDEGNRRRDSILMQSRAAHLPRPAVQEEKPGRIRFVKEYYISATTGLVICRINYMLKKERITSRTVLTMHPKVDVDAFESYLNSD